MRDILKGLLQHIVLKRQRVVVALTALSAIAVVVRAVIAFNGGFWADEAFLLLVVQAPSWTGMLDFLRFHESHPPLFYALVRVWMEMTGGGDTAVLWLPIIIGMLAVPAVYFVGQSLFSRESGLVGAALGAVSPALSEHSAQLRPYGLLPLLTLFSCYAMVMALERGSIRRWAAYVIATVLLLYTHHWGWIVAVGQQFALVLVVVTNLRVRWRTVLREWGFAWTAVVIAYLPWASTLVFQSSHAGHGPLPLDPSIGKVEFVLFASARAIRTILFGSLPEDQPSVVLFGVAASLCAFVFFLLMPRKSPNGIRHTGTPVEERSRAAINAIAIRVFLAVPAGAIVAAVLLTPHSNLLFERCLTALVPLVLVMFAYLYRTAVAGRSPHRLIGPLTAALMGFYVTTSIFGLYELATTPRSNSRHVAAVMRNHLRPTDLVIVAPEWFAASFNHYFPPAVEQIDYPYNGRSGMEDFSNTWERTIDPSPLLRLRARVIGARIAGRRIWFVSVPVYLTPFSERQLATAIRYRRTGPIANLRSLQIRALLERNFGVADSTLVESGKRPRYQDLRAYLYSGSP